MNQAKAGTTVIMYDFNKPINDSWGYWPASTNTPFYSYLFSALGILIAKCLDLSVIWTLWLGRLANLLLYGGFVYFAIKKLLFIRCHSCFYGLFADCSFPKLHHLVMMHLYLVTCYSDVCLFCLHV